MANPDIKYDEIISKFELDGADLAGSIAFCEEEFGKGRVYFGDVIAFDCSDFNYAQHVDGGTPYVKRVLKLTNGMYIDAHIWASENSVNAYIIVVFYYYDSNDVLKLVSGRYDLYRNNYDACYQDVFVQYGFKLYFCTDYYSNHTNTPPIENITEPDFYKLDVVFPCRAIRAGTVHYINGLDGMVTGGVMAVAYDEYMVNSFNNQDNVALFELHFLYSNDLIADLESLETLGGSFPDDPYTTGKYNEDRPPSQENDPSNPGGGNGQYTGGGMGGYDNNSDPIDYPGLPSGGALSTGAIKGFVVGSATIRSIFLNLWNTSLFDPANYQKLLQDPLDALISLHCLPFTPANGAAEQIKMGNYDFQGNISAPVITSQYKTIDCGTLTVPEYWGSAMDRDPYCKVDIYLPFIGIKQLKADDVIGLQMGVKYNVDVLTGDLTAQIKCGQSVLYKYQGNCKAIIPISAQINETMANLIKGAGHVAIGAAAGGLAGAGRAAITAAVNVALSKTNITRSGDLSGSVGLLDHFEPYLIIHRQIQSLAKDFKKFKGYPSNITSMLSGVTGYTEVEYIHLENISGATDAELNEIESLLKAGVII